ncbi:hypothetical protein [Salegentibacter sp. Hel_I_6]|uniref:YobI family P-loop NTPase n=1 Tax=Salegentibacter sp. Hel_I_6 TaxID=1250278 RepID=UPI00055B9836|nr:hypothetical protein [Salegentibacter sp. Hel_I_6]
MRKAIIKKINIWKIAFYKFILKYSKEQINKIEEKFAQTTNFLTPLSPRIISDNSIDSYLISLNEAVRNENITNIALAGSYGSGKSSIIKTFVSKNEGIFNVLELSLASFEKPDESDKSFNKYQKLLELSILQQIIYRVSSKKLPDSRFKRIIDFKWWELFIYSVSILLWLYSSFALFGYGYIKNLNPATWHINNEFDYSALLLSLIFFGGLGTFLYKKGLRFVNNSKVTRISVKGEIDIGKNVNESILNKHLDEVLYFFEKNNFDLVIIEDLDRFNDTHIFSKLREINYLINQSNQISKRVIFLYAVRDDIFEGENRTKFFDLTIPVIPVINYSNSKSKLKDKLLSLPSYKTNFQTKNSSDIVEQNDENLKPEDRNTREILYKPTEDFINQISFFINDMRMVNNICNEYFIYRESLLEIPDQNKLLALIVYKNLEPEDFDLLQNNNGKLHKLIKQKNNFLSKKIEELREEIKGFTEDIESLENMCEENISELRGIYISGIFKVCRDRPTAVRINDKKITFKELFEDDKFKELSECSSITYYTINQNQYEGHRNEPFGFKDIENEVNSNQKYKQRENLVLEKNRNQVEKKKQELSTRKREINLLSTKSIYQILQENTISEYVLDHTDLLKERLIIFLLRNGYIDEHYSHYISRFYDTEITVEEKKFILNVLNEVDNDYNQQMQNEKYVIQNIPKGFFGKQSALNINLLEFLLSNPKMYKNELNDITNLISKEDEYSIDFLESFIENSDKTPQLFSLLTAKWGTIWDYIENHNYERTQIEKLFILIINNSKIENLVNISSKSKFKSYVNNEPIALENLLIKDDITFVKNLIKKMNLEFREIGILESTTNKELKEFLIKESHYQLNFGNIHFILRNYSEKKFSFEDLQTQNLTCILESKFQPLIKYTKENIYYYMNNVFLELKSNTNESESTIIYLLDEDELTDIQKEEAVLQSNQIINDLSKIDDVEAKEILLRNKKLKINWENVLDYFKALGTDTKLNETLEAFLDDKSVNAVLKNLSINRDNPEDETEAETFLGLSIIYNSKLNLQSYSNLIKSLQKDWDGIDLAKIDSKKLKALIDEQIVILKDENFKKLKKTNNYLHLYLIEKNWNIFSENYSNYNLEEGDVHYLLKSDIIQIAQKKKYIDDLDDGFIANDKQLSSIVISILAKLKVKDIEYSFLRDLFKNQNNTVLKIKLLNLNLHSFSQNQLRVLVHRLGGVYSEMVESYHRPNIPETTETLKLIKDLKEKKVISSFVLNEKAQLIEVRAKKWSNSL